MATRRRRAEWDQIPVAITAMPQDAVDRMAKLRRLLLIHSYIYDHLDDNLVSDHQWMWWAQELDRLQKKHGARIGFYDMDFATWDGSSGFHLPSNDPDIHRVSTRLLAYRDDPNCPKAPHS